MESLLFGLLRHAVCGEELKEETKRACTPENLEAIYALARKHDLAHLVAHALEGQTIPDCEAMKKLRTAKMKAIYRYARMDFEFERLCGILEEKQIPFIPMKGIITRNCYPEPWMRTSSDIDILVKETDLRRAADVLAKQGWSIRGEINHHDVHMQMSGGIHLDLHYSIKGNIDASDALLDQVWEYSSPAAGKQYEHRQENTFFIYHLIAHTARHFLSEGCGVRPFLDLWVLRQRITWDVSALQKMCVDAHLETFYQHMTDLSEVWFGEKEHTQATEKMGCYVVNRDKQMQSRNADLFKQIRSDQSGHWGSRLFISYDLLKTTYPILEKKKWLTPVFQAVRWFRKLMDGRIYRILLHWRQKQSVDASEIETAKQFLQEIGLDH